MQFLIKILIKYRTTFVFVFFALFSLSLIIKINPHNEVKAFNFFRNLMYHCFSIEQNITEYFRLKSLNSILQNQNQELIIKNELLVKRIEELKIFSIQKNNKNLNSTVKRYEYITAKVEKKNWTLPNNIIILNKGKLNGVEKNMGVFNNNGVIGIVSHVTNQFCEVTTLINQKMQLLTSIKTADSILNEGVLKWPGNSYRYASIEGVGDDIKINIGDSIFTSTNSNSFYSGMYIGQISDVQLKKSSNSLKINILLGVNFKNIQNALIIKDNLKSELNNFYEDN